MTSLSAKPSVLIGTPAAGEQVSMHYLYMMLAIERRFAELGWRLDVSLRAHGLVTTSRNAFASAVVENADYTHLLMIDADCSFDPSVVERLIAAEQSVVGACVPLRQVKWDRVGSHLERHPDASAEDLAHMSHEFAVSFMPGAGAQATADGFLPARFLGSAVMLLSRDALVRMSESDQVDRYEMGASLGPGTPDFGWTFFDPFVDPERGAYLSEDYAFCQRWRALGGTVYADPRATVTHTGPVSIVGNLSDTIAALAKRP